MSITVQYLSSATAQFLSLQSGMARPYWEANITVSGDSSTTTATLGAAYSANNDIISISNIDREKPVVSSGLSKIFAGDVTIGLNNNSGTYSPRATASIFSDSAGSARDYFHSTINIWAGFVNSSGTAMVIQRGSYLLTELRIDSEKRQAYIHAEDINKIPLSKYVGLPDISGTDTSWLPPSGVTTRSIMTELFSSVGLTAGQYSLATGLSFPKFELVNANIGNEVAKLAQANDGYVFTNGKGQIVFNLNEPTFDNKTSLLSLNSNDNIMTTKYTIKVKDLLNKVVVNYTTGSNESRGASDATVIKGREQIITNETIDKGSIAASVASRTLNVFTEPRPFMQLSNIWMPSLEVGDLVTLTDTGTYQTAVTYEIYKIIDDIDSLKTTVYGIDLTKHESYGPNRQKWGFLSDTSAVNCGTVFANSWHSGFGFVCRDTTTAVNPAFDADGNNDNVITTGYTSSGAGYTGIERPFICY